MPQAILEHANISVSNIERHVDLLEKLAGWKVRWRGPAQSGGEAVHIGTDQQYIALYTREAVTGGFDKGAPLNHLGLVVDDLEKAEHTVVEAGLTPFNHDDYDPGRRFYFFDWDGIEFEIVTYD